MLCRFDINTKNETPLQQALCYKPDTIFPLIYIDRQIS